MKLNLKKVCPFNIFRKQLLADDIQVPISFDLEPEIIIIHQVWPKFFLRAETSINFHLLRTKYSSLWRMSNPLRRI